MGQSAELDNTKAEEDDLADLHDKVTISGTFYSGGWRPWEVVMTWEEIFSLISPYLLEHPNDYLVKSTFEKEAFAKAGLVGTAKIDDQEFQTIKLHLKALDLITVDYLKSTKGGMALFWSLTKLGDKLMMKLRSVKKVIK